MLEQLIASGVDVFRLNFSHGTHEGHAAVAETIRHLASQAGREVALLQDLSGPKIRTGLLPKGAPLELVSGQPFEIRIGDGIGGPGRVTTTYAPLAKAVKPVDRLLLDDGRIELMVEQASQSSIQTRVVDGGRLGEHKGINAPNVPLPAVGVTEKDEADLRFGLTLGVDLVALSFVQSAADIARARSITASAGYMPAAASFIAPTRQSRMVSWRLSPRWTFRCHVRTWTRSGSKRPPVSWSSQNAAISAASTAVAASRASGSSSSARRSGRSSCPLRHADDTKRGGAPDTFPLVRRPPRDALRRPRIRRADPRSRRP